MTGIKIREKKNEEEVYIKKKDEENNINEEYKEKTHLVMR